MWGEGSDVQASLCPLLSPLSPLLGPPWFSGPAAHQLPEPQGGGVCCGVAFISESRGEPSVETLTLLTCWTALHSSFEMAKQHPSSVCQGRSRYLPARSPESSLGRLPLGPCQSGGAGQTPGICLCSDQVPHLSPVFLPGLLSWYPGWDPELLGPPRIGTPGPGLRSLVPCLKGTDLS